MKLALVLLAMVGVSMACETRARKEEFDAFVRRYRKSYATENEYNFRCKIFSNNYDLVESHNMRAARSIESYTLEINQFADLTPEDFKNTYLGFRHELLQTNPADDSLPRSFLKADEGEQAELRNNVDWSMYMSPIKDQGSCGACYAFATHGAIEARHNMKYAQNPLNPDLSEQQLIECSTGHGNQRCQGGHMLNCYNYLTKANHGCMHESKYPYLMSNGSNTCGYDAAHAPVKITGWTEIARDDASLLKALQTGPVAVAMHHSMQEFMLYKGGLFCPKKTILGRPGCPDTLLALDHAVVLYGATSEAWLVQNSFGPSWGEAGRIRMCRSTDNICGINRSSSYPAVA